MTEPIVTVVLSTFNGECYLPELLASLAAQSRRPDRIVLRDDGSRDASPAIVADWARRENIVLQHVAGPPMGPAKSFLAAIAAAEPTDVMLLADQDDVWLPEKVERAIAMLPYGPSAQPMLYASALHIVGAALQPIRESVPVRHLGFASAAYESVLTGCTMALNGALIDLVRVEPQVRVQMHDWWLYTLAAATGGIVFDEHSTILYRQHGANVLGAGPKGWKALLARIRRLRVAPGARRSDQLEQLLSLHASRMHPEALELACLLVKGRTSLIRRIYTAFAARVLRQADHDVLTTRFAILINRF